MANFESKNIIDILENNTLINTLHEKMEKRKSYYQPQPEDFIGEAGYSEAEIREELQKVSDLKKKWQAQNTPEFERQKKISDVLEGIIVNQLSGPWFVQKAPAYLNKPEIKVEGHYTSEADDLLRGVDVIAELQEDEDSHYLGLAIDVTMAKDQSVLDEKLEKNWKDIETGRFAQVKYFEDPDGNKQKLEPVKILVAVNPQFARELIRREYLDKKELLAEHVFQFHLAFQIKQQLESYYLYAKAKGDEKLMEKLAESLRIFYKIISGERENELADHEVEVARDSNFQRIKSYGERKVQSA